MSKTLKKEEKETMLDNLYDEYEYDLEFIGCSAIEDQLQEDVP
jgi:magnesium-transporting ATPase (P-type)